MSPEPARFQFLVVGAGSAGCVVAGRLAEAGASTLLIEAGPTTTGLEPAGRSGLIDPERHRESFWPPLSEVRDAGIPESEVGQPYWMGRRWGGGSAVNGMLVMPGDRADYDRWAQLDGCADWASEAMTPWLEKALVALDPEDWPPDPETAALVAAFDDGFGGFGLQPAGTTLDRDRSGLLTPALATSGGSRRSVADAYLGIADPNLSVRANRTAVAIVVEDGSARGVVLDDGETIRASTVVLAAGSVGSALLLHDTGLVPRAGTWIRNHAAAAIPFPWPVGRSVAAAPRPHRVARWCSETAMSTGPADATKPAPDLTAILMGPFRDPEGLTGAVMVMASTVRSSGRLDLESDPPRLISNRLTNVDDLVRLRQGSRRALAVCSRLARLADRPSTGRRLIDDLSRLADGELDDWLIRHPGPVYHAVGSCRMGGSSLAGVVTRAEPGHAGTVDGLGGVVVADASLFPDLVGGGLQLPVMAVAERVTAETLLRSSARR